MSDRSLVGALDLIVPGTTGSGAHVAWHAVAPYRNPPPKSWSQKWNPAGENGTGVKHRATPKWVGLVNGSEWEHGREPAFPWFWPIPMLPLEATKQGGLPSLERGPSKVRGGNPRIAQGETEGESPHSGDPGPHSPSPNVDTGASLFFFFVVGPCNCSTLATQGCPFCSHGNPLGPGLLATALARCCSHPRGRLSLVTPSSGLLEVFAQLCGLEARTAAPF